MWAAPPPVPPGASSRWRSVRSLVHREAAHPQRGVHSALQNSSPGPHSTQEAADRLLSTHRNLGFSQVHKQVVRSRTCPSDSKFSARSWYGILAPFTFDGRDCASEHQNGETHPLGFRASENWGVGDSSEVWLRGEQRSSWVPSSMWGPLFGNI